VGELENAELELIRLFTTGGIILAGTLTGNRTKIRSTHQFGQRIER
jgi:hypothetical protein